MSDALLSSLVETLGQEQLVQSAREVKRARKALQAAQAEAEKAKDVQALAYITPVDDEILDVSNGAPDVEIMERQLGLSSGSQSRKVAVHYEAVLHRAVSQLAARFSALTGEHLGKKWYQHFEAWLFGRRAEALTALPAAMATSARSKPGAQAAAASPWEQILPKGQLGVMTAADVELQRKLSAAGAPPALTDVVIAELARLPRMLAAKDGPAGGPAPHVKVSPFKGQQGAVDKLKLSCLGVTLEVNKRHFDKLRVLYAYTVQRTSGHYDASAFTQAAMAVLLRYSSLQGTHHRGGGFQAAAHSEVFHVLRDSFDCRFECFASPFNCRYTRYCSMFPDTDGPFGSSGSFFRFAPTAGSFQANPPFDKQFVDAMADHMFKLLGAASGPLMFSVIIPAWEGHACWQRLERSTYTARHVLLLAAEHGFFEGAQHNRANRFRAASTATSVFFLQNAAARARWPVGAAHEAQLRAAFAPKCGAPEARGTAEEAATGTDAMIGGDFAEAAPTPQAARAHKKRKRDRAAAKQVVAEPSAQPRNATPALGTQAGDDVAGAVVSAAHAADRAALSTSAQPTRKRRSKKGCAAATGKFADAGAAAAVLDRVLASVGGASRTDDDASRSRHTHKAGSGNAGGDGHEPEITGRVVMGRKSGEPEVVFAMSKSQRRSHRQHRVKKLQGRERDRSRKVSNA